MRHHFSSRLSLVGAVTALALSACAPAPIYPTAPNTVMVSPTQAAQTPEQFASGSVVWGGRVVSVQNLTDHSELEILAYPLDSSQRPKLDKTAIGRFIAIMPGYVEALNYPAGAAITIAGNLHGTRADKVGDASYVFPLVTTAASHLWTQAELTSGKVSFGVGVAGGFR